MLSKEVLMPGCFDVEKATQMAAYLLAKSKGAMPYLKLVKLLYIADREALRRWGYPLTGDRYASLDHGPVVSQILDLIRHGPVWPGSKHWVKYIETRDRDKSVRLREWPPFDLLSDAAKSLLDEIYEEYGRLNTRALRDLVNKFPEWKDPRGSSIPISYVDILKAVGREDEAEELAEEIEAKNRFKQALSSA